MSNHLRGREITTTEAEAILHELRQLLTAEGYANTSTAGSFRRGAKKIFSDLDLVVEIPDEILPEDANQAVITMKKQNIIAAEKILKALSKDPRTNKTSMSGLGGHLLFEGVQVDIFPAQRSSWAPTLTFWTGDRTANEIRRKRASDRGLILGAHYLVDRERNTLIQGMTESELHEMLGCSVPAWVPSTTGSGCLATSGRDR